MANIQYTFGVQHKNEVEIGGAVNLNGLAKEIYDNAVSKGFYEDNPNTATRIALMHSELSEALEADRKDLMSEKLPGRTGVEEEYADCIIRILDDSANKGFDIHGAVLEKMAYNLTRPYKHGGKKY